MLGRKWEGRSNRRIPVQATPKDIKEVFSSRTEEQQLKESRNTKQSHGHIVSYNPFNRLQPDIFVLQNMRVLIMVMVIYCVLWIYSVEKHFSIL